MNRKRFPRRFTPFACRVFPVPHRDFPRFPRAPRPRRYPLACNTGWPGGFIDLRPERPLPDGFVRTRSMEPGERNPRCYPQIVTRDVATGSGGTLTAGISAARNEAQRLSLESQREALKLAPRALGTSIEAQNAFALRFGEDTCEPFFCAFDGATWSTSSNRNVLKGRGRFAEFASKGFRLVPLDITAIRAKVGREPTGTELIAACGTDAFHIQSQRLRARTGRWVNEQATAIEQATGTGAGRRRLTLKSGAAPLPGAPAAPLGPGDPFPLGTRVWAGHPRGPWGNPAYYDGPYLAGLAAYYVGRNGVLGLDPAAARAALGL